MSGKQYSLDSRMDLVHGLKSTNETRPASEPTELPRMLEEETEPGDTTVHIMIHISYKITNRLHKYSAILSVSVHALSLIHI